MYHFEQIKLIKNELQNIVSGKSFSGYEATIQTICNVLRTSEKSGPLAKEKHEFKNQETASLIHFAQQNNWFFKEINPKDFISEVAEHRRFT